MENDCILADIILPVTTKFEQNDIMEDQNSGVYQSVYREYQACPPVGKSVTDFEAVARVAAKLGKDYYDAYTLNLSEEELIERFFYGSGVSHLVDYDKFKKDGIFIVPPRTDFDKYQPGLRKFAEDPASQPLTTPTGLLEFTSTDLQKHFPEDPERPPFPKWIESGPSHDERLSSPRAKKYPLLCMSNHGRWRMHAQGDDITWTREIDTMKLRGRDGYQYEPIWLHPETAKERGIAHGDIVRIFNERGAVLGAAYVTERVMPRVAYMDHGARFDPIDAGCLDGILRTSLAKSR